MPRDSRAVQLPFSRLPRRDWLRCNVDTTSDRNKWRLSAACPCELVSCLHTQPPSYTSLHNAVGASLVTTRSMAYNITCHRYTTHPPKPPELPSSNLVAARHHATPHGPMLTATGPADDHNISPPKQHIHVDIDNQHEPCLLH